MATAVALMTAEEYRLLPDDGPPTELARGRIIPKRTRTPRLPECYPDVLPEVVVEMRARTDRWIEVIKRVSEYLTAGVGVVCVLDPQSAQAFVFYSSDQPPRIFSARVRTPA